MPTNKISNETKISFKPVKPQLDSPRYNIKPKGFNTQYETVNPYINVSECITPSRAKSQYENECDLNQIVARAKRTGQPPLLDRRGVYADVSNIGDYLDAQLTVKQAHDDFLNLPVQIRNRFRNNPAYLIDFLSNPNNYDEALKLGLVNKRPAPAVDTNVPPTAEGGKKEEK